MLCIAWYCNAISNASTQQFTLYDDIDNDNRDDNNNHDNDESLSRSNISQMYNMDEKCE
jgi:hypothetical protein